MGRREVFVIFSVNKCQIFLEWLHIARVSSLSRILVAGLNCGCGLLVTVGLQQI